MPPLPASLEGRPWAAIGLSFAVAVAGFVLVIPVGLFVGILAGLFGVSITPVLAVVLGLLSLQGIAFPATAAAYLRLRDKTVDYVRARVPSLSDLGWATAGFIGALTLAFTMLVVVQLLSAPTASRTDQELLRNPEVLLALIPLSFLLIGPGEELLFRGVIQSTLRETFDAPVAIVLASFAFAPAHIVSLTGSLSALFVSISVLFIPSLVFGAIYEHTDNLAVPALAHGAYNSVIFGISYVAIVYGPENASYLGGLF